MAILFLGLIYYQSTLVTGTEFNVRTWELRQFHFRRDPFTNHQWSGVSHSPASRGDPWSAVAKQLTSTIDPAIGKLLSTSNSVPDRWDLVTISTARYQTGDAVVLVNLLSAVTPDHDRFWIGWSKDQSAKAKILWPAVQDLAQFELYAKLPPLFEMALSDLDETQFRQAVEGRLQQSLLDAASRQPSEVAAEMARVGLTYGDHSELQQLINGTD